MEGSFPEHGHCQDALGIARMQWVMGPEDTHTPEAHDGSMVPQCRHHHTRKQVIHETLKVFEPAQGDGLDSNLRTATQQTEGWQGSCLNSATRTSSSGYFLLLPAY